MSNRDCDAMAAEYDRLAANFEAAKSDMVKFARAIPLVEHWKRMCALGLTIRAELERQVAFAKELLRATGYCEEGEALA